MNIILMNRFGRILTDRTYGKTVAEKILKEETFPAVLDFKGVISLGSSCGDEILSAIKTCQNEVTIQNANKAVESCLEKVAVDLNLHLVV